MKPTTNGKKTKLWLALLTVFLASTFFVLYKRNGANCGFAYAQKQDSSAASAKAFLKASKVLLHPRCVNCHPEGDHPLTGDQSLPHPMNIERGPDGIGIAGLSCSGCHQDRNLPGEHSPPGASEWDLPTKMMPMIFEKRTPRQICEHLKDPSQNGGRNLDQILEHVREAPPVLWAWNPGGGRTPPSMSHDEFVQAMTEWSTMGAACPE